VCPPRRGWCGRSLMAIVYVVAERVDRAGTRAGIEYLHVEGPGTLTSNGAVTPPENVCVRLGLQWGVEGGERHGKTNARQGLQPCRWVVSATQPA
jgi:hypothetical protein